MSRAHTLSGWSVSSRLMFAVGGVRSARSLSHPLPSLRSALRRFAPKQSHKRTPYFDWKRMHFLCFPKYLSGAGLTRCNAGQDRAGRQSPEDVMAGQTKAWQGGTGQGSPEDGRAGARAVRENPDFFPLSGQGLRTAPHWGLPDGRWGGNLTECHTGGNLTAVWGGGGGATAVGGLTDGAWGVNRWRLERTRGHSISSV